MGWNFNDNTPIYLQIINGLQREIASGAYPPGSRLASVRDTMQRALAELERQGLVNSQRTAGRFVTEDTAALSALRRSMSDEIIADFFRSMQSLGLSNEEILSLVQDWVLEHSKEEH